MKIKMHAMYDHFPELTPQDGAPYIDCYSDSHVKECTSSGKNIALLLEPRSMIGEYYNYVYEHANYFRYIFTHDSQLLTLPQARLFTWSDIWLTTDSEKNKGISLCTSYKDWCPLHHARLELARQFNNNPKVDVYYGAWGDSVIPEVKAKDYLEHYKFSIIIENDIDDYWYTEKILNCFATKTIPIYVGSPIIHKLFNGRGIIQCTDWHEIPHIVEHLDVDREYQDRLDAVNYNFMQTEPWKTPWKERFFRDYGDLLEELLNE